METSADERGDQAPGLIERFQEFLEDDRRKWGGMTPGAMGRLGLAELREAVSLDSGNEAITPYGMYGTLTPGEVAAERRPDAKAEQMDHEMELQADRVMTPGEIAGGIFGPDTAQANGRGAEAMSPGDIGQDNSVYTPDQDLGRGLDQGRGR